MVIRSNKVSLHADDKLMIYFFFFLRRGWAFRHSLMLKVPVTTAAEDFLKDYFFFFLGPVVQSIISLTSLLWVISLTVLADSIYNILIFFAEKM